jgi:hypothetical protein
MNLNEILEQSYISLQEGTGRGYKPNETERRWDKEKKAWIYKHREVMGLEPGDPRVVHHKDHNQYNNDPSNLEIVTRKVHSQIDPNARKYHEGDTCKISGCSNEPFAKNLCIKHYMQMRRKKGLPA